ncbi:flagellar basal body rod protein FlgB [archaeon]|nr:MAG: flagellar basal body rod protein FlgB [archaeon]
MDFVAFKEGVMDTKSVLSALERGLTFCARRQQVLASNIANAQTPGYKAFDLVMKDLGDKEPEGRIQLAATHFNHIRGPADLEMAAEVEMVVTVNTYPSLDGNTVDVDREMAKLSENNLRYQTLVRVLVKKFGRIRMAITGEGR